MSDITSTTAKEQVLKAVDLLFTSNVMSHSGHANLSARLTDDTYLITNTGMVRNLTSDNFAVVDLNGKVLEGTLEPTNLEIVDMHSIVYKARKDVGAIIHTHSPHVLAFALANRPLPCRYEALLRFGQATDVPVANWGPRGSKESVEAIEKTLAENPQTSSLILANHGLLAFGATPLAVAGLISALEEGAEAELRALEIGGAVNLPDGALSKIRESMAKARQ